MIIPNSVTRIGYEAFRNCSNLASMTIPFVGVSSTGEGTNTTHFGYIFGASRSNNNTTYVPASLKQLTITEPNPIYANAFRGCKNLKTIYLPEGLISLADSTFYECENLVEIITPDSLITIGESAFMSCSSLASISIPETVTTIGYGAFGYCGQLASIELSVNVDNVGSGAFNGCESLVSMTLPFSAVPSNKFKHLFSNYQYKVPKSLKTVYLIAGDQNSKIDFSDCKDLDTIVLEGNISSITSNAFASCSSLTSVTIPESVTSIGQYAFYNCVSLEEVILPDELTDIETNAFWKCENLNSINIPNSLTTIKTKAFQNCTSLEFITIPGSVETMGADIFLNCDSMQTIYVDMKESEKPTTWHNNWNRRKTGEFIEVLWMGDM